MAKRWRRRRSGRRPPNWPARIVTGSRSVRFLQFRRNRKNPAKNTVAERFLQFRRNLSRLHLAACHRFLQFRRDRANPAKKRQGARTDLNIPTVPEGSGDSGEAVAQAAALVGLGATSVYQAKAVIDRSQLAMIAVKMLEPLKAEAKKRQVASLKQGGVSPVPTVPEERGELISVSRH